MGLAVVVGMWADLVEADPDGVEYFRGLLEQVNAVLAENRLPPHDEPDELPPLDSRSSLDGYPYSFLHHLRRAYARRAEDSSWVAEPLGEDDDPSNDPVVQRQTMRMKSHLLCHSDAEGFYLPIDFKPVLFDERDRVPGGMLGSSYRLRDELVYVAPALGIRLASDQLADAEANAINEGVDQQEGIWIERTVWLSLFEATRLSIKHKAAVCFS